MQINKNMNNNILNTQDGIGLVAKERHAHKDGLSLVEKERELQKEFWDPETTEEGRPGDLHKAGIAYALTAGDWQKNHPPFCWPYHIDSFKPSHVKVENLIKAAAYIIADIDRIYANFQSECNAITLQKFGFRCFDQSDAYDLEEKDWVGIRPENFIRQHFKADYELIDEGESDK